MLTPRAIPLQRVLIIPFLLQISAAVGMVGYFSYRNGEQAVHNLTNQLMDRASEQVAQQLNSYTKLPVQLTQMNLDAIASGDLDIKNRVKSERYFWRLAKAFSNLSYIGYTLEDESSVGAGRWIKGLGILIYEDFPGPNNTSDYISDEKGARQQRLQTYDYADSLEWYRETISAKKLIWSKIAINEDKNSNLSQAGKELLSKSNISQESAYALVSGAAPFYDKKGQVLGTIGIDLTLRGISDYLRDRPVSPSGQTFIMDRDGLMVGSSGNQPIYRPIKGHYERYKAIESPDLRIKSISQGIQQNFPNLNTIQTTEKINLTIDGRSEYIQIKPWKDEYGLDWLVIINIPESDFMAQINENNNTTILLCIAALCTTTVLGFVTTRWITQSILALSRAAQSISKGNLDQQVAPTRIKELESVGQSFSHMARQLKTSFADLARSNTELEDRVADRTRELRSNNIQLTTTLEALHQTQTQMVQSEKMSALGQMVAGVAHEINNPVNFIHGNLKYVNDYTQDLLQLIEAYQKHLPIPPKELQQQIEDIDLVFLTRDFIQIIQSMQVGTSRIREIVLSLRSFSRLDEAEFKAVDLHDGINSTLLLLRHRLQPIAGKPEIKVIQNYGSLPHVECYPGQLNQVLMNLISNAIDALEGGTTKPLEQPHTIHITTELHNNNARITIADNGCGIPEEVRSRIFDPFFTTKPIGKGTGLGLSISYQIITERHHGRLFCDSILGKETQFCIEIPVQQGN